MSSEAERLLADGRRMIVTDAARDLSRIVHGLEVDGEALRGRIREAVRRLEAAEAASESDGAAEEAAIVQDHVEVLRAFAEVFEAIAASEDSAASRRRLTEAGIQLAAYADDPNEGIAESAAFWQSVAYRHAGRIDRALQLISPRLAKPQRGRLRLLGQMQRCRALAQTGSHVAALSLAMKLEVRIPSWLGEAPSDVRRAAEVSLRWIRVAILRDWAQRLRESGDSELSQEAERRAKTLLADDAWPPPEDGWLHLEESIAGLDEWDRPAEPPPPDEDATTQEAPEHRESEDPDPGAG